MSTIEDMICDLCPDGVKRVKLGEVCKSLKKATLTQGDLKEGGEYPVINSGRTLYGYYSAYNNEGNAFIIAARGEYAGFVNYMSNKFWAGGLCYPYRSKDECILMTKFVYYYLKSFENTMRETLVSRGSIPAINKGDIDQVEIPLPPLPIQEKIVEILEKFSLLSAELEAELEGRRKQYDFYRNRLLSFDSSSDSVQWKALGELCDKRCNLSYGIVQPGEDVEDGVPIVRPVDLGNGIIDVSFLKKTRKDISDAYKRTILHGNEILICVRGTTGVLELAHEGLKGCNVTRGIVPIAVDSLYCTRYIYHVLKSDIIQSAIASKTNGAALQQINVKDLRQLSIPIPPLAEQERIVKILDKFEALVTDLSAGLPAEIERVQKQYEYYRNKLLTFPEA